MRSLVAALMLCAFTGSFAVAVAPYGSVKPRQPVIACDAVPVVKLYQDRIEISPARGDLQVASLAPADLPLPYRDEAVSAVDVPQPLPRPRDLTDSKPAKAQRASLLDEARKYIGTNPTGWASLWCGRFMAMIAPELAKKVPNPNWARDWAEALPKTKHPKPGDIVVLSRGKVGGHIGVLKKFDKNGDPIIVSGNTSGRAKHRVVAEGRFSKSRVIAYVVAGL